MRGSDDWSRFVLGTVQLGVSYGSRQQEPVLEEVVAGRILDAAWELGIRAFDTAEAYGLSPVRLADWIKRRGCADEIHVVTKVAADEAGDYGRLMAATERYSDAASLTLLTHGIPAANDFDVLKSFAARGGFLFGQSVYTGTEVANAATAGALRVQAPLNALDRRQIDVARHAGVAFDGRSIYLQGLLLDAPEIAERRARGGAEIVRAVRSAARQANLQPAVALCAAALAGLGSHDRIVVGIDAPEQLAELAAAQEVSRDEVGVFTSALTQEMAALPNHTAFLDPRKWSPA